MDDAVIHHRSKRAVSNVGSPYFLPCTSLHTSDGAIWKYSWKHLEK